MSNLFGALGRISNKTEHLDGSQTELTPRYDPAGRLVEVTRDGTVVEAYTYDKNGNRLTVLRDGVTSEAEVDAQDRLIRQGDTRYVYNANGDLETKTNAGDKTTRTHYDALGNLKQVELPDGRRIDYLVDAAGRRVGKKINGALVKAWLYQDALNWTFTEYEDGEYHLGPAHVSRPGFFEDYFCSDGDIVAQAEAWRAVRDALELMKKSADCEHRSLIERAIRQLESAEKQSETRT